MSDEDLFDHGQRIAALELKVADLYKRLGQAEPASGFGGGFGDPPDPAQVAGEDPRVVQLLQSGKEIQAIKLYRELTGVGLAEAKDAVDNMRDMYRPTG